VKGTEAVTEKSALADQSAFAADRNMLWKVSSLTLFCKGDHGAKRRDIVESGDAFVRRMQKMLGAFMIAHIRVNRSDQINAMQLPCRPCEGLADADARNA